MVTSESDEVTSETAEVTSESDETSRRDMSVLRSNTDEEPSEMDTIAHALSDERRRRMLHYVVCSEGPTGFDELVEHSISSATWPTPRASDSNHVAIRLYHVDLPKLAAADLVEYDRERRVVEATGTGDELGTLFDGLDR